MPITKQFLPVKLSMCAVACAIAAGSIKVHAPVGFQQPFLPLKVANPFIKTVTMMTIMTAHPDRQITSLSTMIIKITGIITITGIIAAIVTGITTIARRRQIGDLVGLTGFHPTDRKCRR
ncbi:hypothetical protein [uncultured Bartonella sp.]|uniref:hypothetical protein n=1 Tax=uncultured Bartonella sp. TaxID=104108 RepID=UPI0026277DD7|nr:hypothetical protein [uncultured Bartonella sp.]